MKNKLGEIKIRKKEDRSCPCLYLKQPCHDNCDCVNGFSSSGCLNCCSYGSLEQRTRMAEILNEKRLFYDREHKVKKLTIVI